MKSLSLIALALFALNANASDYCAADAVAAAVRESKVNGATTKDIANKTTEILTKGELYQVSIDGFEYVVSVNAVTDAKEGICIVTNVYTAKKPNE